MLDSDTIITLTTNSLNNDKALLNLCKELGNQIQMLTDQNERLVNMIQLCNTRNNQLERRLDALLSAFYSHFESNVNQ